MPLRIRNVLVFEHFAVGARLPAPALVRDALRGPASGPVAANARSAQRCRQPREEILAR
jgi:hypothetical protein